MNNRSPKKNAIHNQPPIYVFMFHDKTTTFVIITSIILC